MTPAEIHALNDQLRLAGPHRPRPIRFLRVEPIGDWQIKVYTIAAHAVRPWFLDETLRRAPEMFPAVARTDQHYGIGFIVAHDSATAGFAIYYWWQGFNELHQRVLASWPDDPTAMVATRHPPAGCVWELEVVDFERRAWLTDVLANPAGPDVARYLGRHTDTEV